MIEGNIKNCEHDLNDHQIAEISSMANEHISDFENYREAYDYFLKSMLDGISASFCSNNY